MDPFIKWVGGKRRLVEQLRPLLPDDYRERTHVELFVGGAAMFFALRPERALLGDVNTRLIRTYVGVQTDVNAVIAQLATLSGQHSEEHYYAARERFNKATDLSDVECAALLIYLNKTCFNGLFRMNREGEMNVPIGEQTKPRVLDVDALRSANAALQGVTLVSGDFDVLSRHVDDESFVYLDPPYVAEVRNGFVGYGAAGFSVEDQHWLRDLCRDVSARGARVMLSNSDTELVRELYAGFRLTTVASRRSVSRNAAGRCVVPELVVRNYG